MAVVGFLGMYEGFMGVEATMLGCAVSSALLRNEHVLLAHLGQEASALTSLLATRLPTVDHLPEHFGARDGLDGLLRQVSFNRYADVEIRDYIMPVLKGRVDLLSGSRIASGVTISFDMCEHLLQRFRQSYRATFVRLPQQIFCDEQAQMVEAVDLLVICLTQDAYRMRTFFEQLTHIEHRLPEQLVFIICDYDSGARFNTSLIKKQYAHGWPLYALPYCTDFRNAANEGEFVDLLLRRLLRAERMERAENARCFLEYRNFVATLAERMFA